MSGSGGSLLPKHKGLVTVTMTDEEVGNSGEAMSGSVSHAEDAGALEGHAYSASLVSALPSTMQPLSPQAVYTDHWADDGLVWGFVLWSWFMFCFVF